MTDNNVNNDGTKKTLTQRALELSKQIGKNKEGENNEK